MGAQELTQSRDVALPTFGQRPTGRRVFEDWLERYPERMAGLFEKTLQHALRKLPKAEVTDPEMLQFSMDDFLPLLDSAYAREQFSKLPPELQEKTRAALWRLRVAPNVPKSFREELESGRSVYAQK